MKRMILVSILVFTIFFSGCISQIATPQPMTGPPPPFPNESTVHFGGTSLVIAFNSNEISTTSPEAKELFIKGLTSLSQSGRYNESLQYFDAALAIDPNFSEAWLAKGVAFHNMKQYDEAVRCYDNALVINPRDAGTWHVKGRSGIGAGLRRQRNATGELPNSIRGIVPGSF
ncbi:MAG: tetratricopeptide repeat protein [Methanoregula sp.]